MKIFGMGGLELVIILVVILLIFGPKNLPKLGSALGKTLSNLRSGMSDGKKKKKDEASDEADSAAADDANSQDVRTPELEGEVEVADATDAAGEAESRVSEQGESPDTVDSDAVSVEGDAARAPKKVRRVVKKKVETE